MRWLLSTFLLLLLSGLTAHAGDIDAGCGSMPLLCEQQRPYMKSNGRTPLRVETFPGTTVWPAPSYLRVTHRDDPVRFLRTYMYVDVLGLLKNEALFVDLANAYSKLRRQQISQESEQRSQTRAERAAAERTQRLVQHFSMIFEMASWIIELGVAICGEAPLSEQCVDWVGNMGRERCGRSPSVECVKAWALEVLGR